MAKLKIYKQTGETAGELELDSTVFDVEYNEALIHQAVVAQMNNARQGTKSTLTRSEVRGGGIKPWRQKGTGRARQGSIRSPQWVKGGVVFAPKPRDFSQKVNKQAKRSAFLSALSAKVADDEVMLVDKLVLPAAKTKEISTVMKALKLDIKKHKRLNESGEIVEATSKALPKILLVVTDNDQNVVRAASNLPYVKTIESNLLSIYDIVANDKCVFTVDAVKKVEEAYKA